MVSSANSLMLLLIESGMSFMYPCPDPVLMQDQKRTTGREVKDRPFFCYIFFEDIQCLVQL